MCVKWQVDASVLTSTHHLLEYENQFSTHLLPNCYNWYCGNKFSLVGHSLWNNFIPVLWFLVCFFLFFHLLTSIDCYSLLILISGRNFPLTCFITDSQILTLCMLYLWICHYTVLYLIHVPIVPVFSCLFQKGVTVSTLLSAWACS